MQLLWLVMYSKINRMLKFNMLQDHQTPISKTIQEGHLIRELTLKVYIRTRLILWGNKTTNNSTILINFKTTKKTNRFLQAPSFINLKWLSHYLWTISFNISILYQTNYSSLIGNWLNSNKNSYFSINSISNSRPTICVTIIIRPMLPTVWCIKN